MKDKSIKPCAIKKVKYNSEQKMECALWELVALQAAVGLRNVVQCLGAFFSGSFTDGTRKLVIITECASPSWTISCPQANKSFEHCSILQHLLPIFVPKQQCMQHALTMSSCGHASLCYIMLYKGLMLYG